MDWDDVRAMANEPVQLGADLSTLSLAELDDRIEALQAEIARVEAEKARKAAQNDAANAVFKS